jgi:hypothetical protein
MDELDQFYQRRYHERIGRLPPLQRLMLDLDSAVTGVSPAQCIGQYHHYPKTLEEWYEKNAGGNLEWYLSDGGYSRVVWSEERKHLFLTDNSTSKAKANWEKALPQREAVERYMREETDRLTGGLESRAMAIVNNLLEMRDDLMPPKPEFGSDGEDLEFHTRTPFNAYSHALERGHHQQLWDKVKGSVYEPLYRKRFNVGESRRTPSMDKLKEHRVKLDPQERNMVIRKQAVWPQSGGKPVPGVWKAVIEGKSWYVCNTHRAAAIKPTLRAAIKAFEFIKTTS